MNGLDEVNVPATSSDQAETTPAGQLKGSGEISARGHVTALDDAMKKTSIAADASMDRSPSFEDENVEASTISASTPVGETNGSALGKNEPGADASSRHNPHQRTQRKRQRRGDPNRRWNNVRKSSSTERYAALDLGTNNCRLLIAEPTDSGFQILDSFSRIVRLGQGISINNRLSDEASDRAVQALRICWNKLSYHKIPMERARLIATEACRAAENGSSFLDRVRTEIGLNLEIIDRQTEARLAVTGCASLVENRSEGVVLFDIGGGSSELVWMDRRGRRKRNRLGGTLRSWDSLPVGVVTLSERFNGRDVTVETFEAMVESVQQHLADFPKKAELERALARGRHHLLGTSGTVTTLAGIHLNLRRYDRKRVDGMWMSDEEASRMIYRLLDMSYEERVNHPCIGAERADLVLPGCAIFEAIRREFPCKKLRIADRGLREGILVELMQENGHQVKNRSKKGRQKPGASRA